MAGPQSCAGLCVYASPNTQLPHAAPQSCTAQWPLLLPAAVSLLTACGPPEGATGGPAMLAMAGACHACQLWAAQAKCPSCCTALWGATPSTPEDACAREGGVWGVLLGQAAGRVRKALPDGLKVVGMMLLPQGSM